MFKDSTCASFILGSFNFHVLSLGANFFSVFLLIFSLRLQIRRWYWVIYSSHGITSMSLTKWNLLHWSKIQSTWLEQPPDWYVIRWLSFFTNFEFPTTRLFETANSNILSPSMLPKVAFPIWLWNHHRLKASQNYQ